MGRGRPVLWAEDSESDVALFRIALERVGAEWHLVRAHDGGEAIRILSGEPMPETRERYPMPCLVLTDIKMPKVGGFELLEWMRKHVPEIPVIAMSSSVLESDLRRAVELGASAYFVKPGTLEGLMKLAKQLTDEWVRDWCEEGEEEG